MIRQNLNTAEEISKIRWNFISEVNAKTILDYGSGPGFFKIFSPNGTKIYTYDIGCDEHGNKYPQTGLPNNPVKFDIVCFWDVLEHIKDIREIEPFLAQTENIAISVPIVKEGIDLEKWKHFKPGEHVFYFTKETLSLFFLNYGFKMIKSGMPECPPRVDILSAIFNKK